MVRILINKLPAYSTAHTKLRTLRVAEVTLDSDVNHYIWFDHFVRLYKNRCQLISFWRRQIVPVPVLWTPAR
jgi:hypothetical protein